MKEQLKAVLGNVVDKVKYAGMYIKYRAKLIHFSKYHFKLWFARIALNFSYVLQGLIGIVTLNFIEPNLSMSPSQRVALRKSDAHDYQSLLSEKKALEDAVKEESEKANQGGEVDTDKITKAEARVDELNKKQETFDDVDAEMEEWAAKFAKKKNYDSQGHLIKE